MATLTPFTSVVDHLPLLELLDFLTQGFQFAAVFDHLPDDVVDGNCEDDDFDVYEVLNGLDRRIALLDLMKVVPHDAGTQDAGSDDQTEALPLIPRHRLGLLQLGLVTLQYTQLALPWFMQLAPHGLALLAGVTPPDGSPPKHQGGKTLRVLRYIHEFNL